MNGNHRKEGPYKSPRPAVQRSNVVRLPGNLGHASGVMSASDEVELCNFVSTIIAMGFCISFTSTSDGYAVSLTVYDGATRWKQYARDPDELLTCYRDLLAAIRGEA